MCTCEWRTGDCLDCKTANNFLFHGLSCMHAVCCFFLIVDCCSMENSVFFSLAVSLSLAQSVFTFIAEYFVRSVNGLPVKQCSDVNSDMKVQ